MINDPLQCTSLPVLSSFCWVDNKRKHPLYGIGKNFRVLSTTGSFLLEKYFLMLSYFVQMQNYNIIFFQT